MKSVPHWLIGLALLLPLAACVSPAVQAPAAPPRTATTFNAPKDKVWPLIIAEVGLTYPVQALEKESGLITTSFVSLPVGFGNRLAGQWILPPGGFLATWNGLRMSMKILAVETEPGKTLVKINCHYEAFENNVQKTWVVAQSNGSVENAILTKLEAQLNPKPDVAAAK
jgi:hypothetical protein